MPETGFVVRASIMPPHPPVRISEAGATPDSATSQPLLVNVVSHHAVQRPVVPSPSGAPVLVEEERGWSGALHHVLDLTSRRCLTFHIHKHKPTCKRSRPRHPGVAPRRRALLGHDQVSSRFRHAFDHGSSPPFLPATPHTPQPPAQTSSGGGTTVDVLVSPWVVREALKHRLFQAQLVNLALEWVAQETGLGVRADGPCVVLPAAVCSYWDSEQGGMGKPRPFVVDEVRTPRQSLSPGLDIDAHVYPTTQTADQAVARQQLAPEERPERALQGKGESVFEHGVLANPTTMRPFSAAIDRFPSIPQTQTPDPSWRPCAGTRPSPHPRRPQPLRRHC